MYKILYGNSKDILKIIESESIDCIVTSPPYWSQRDYGVDGQLGLEPIIKEYINNLCDIFDECKRVLKKSGTCWVVIDDTYYGGGRMNGSSPEKLSYKQKSNRGTATDDKAMLFKWENELPKKCLCQIPARFAIEMIDRGWILRNEIIWEKPNAMCESVKDRFTMDYEKIYFFTKRGDYYFEQQLEKYINVDKSIRANINKKHINDIMSTCASSLSRKRLNRPNVDGRNKRSVWSIPTQPSNDAHYAVYPEKLIWPMIKAGCPDGGMVLDPFSGSGTTLLVAEKLKRNSIGIELNKEYIKMAHKRLSIYTNQYNLF